ncbi:GNAT family N-acetyltransferase [Domibacillus mangrovi]|uniref:GNAT family N-acetyltransferase n=1 Tax=Domibacillus mangrovi TaxID=1714354 RepID=A0A1Q5NZ25_9BACI|nr:GNAT family N-acetyltransferase [Domibacillus mangrovi]OKL35254.1 GNAT family N-acetyltransferase [Domibacillus mangrovi]
MKTFVRKAIPEDASFSVPLILEAIGDIAYRLTGETNKQAVETALMKLFIRSDNRHSYRYTYIAEKNGTPAGILVLYYGAEAVELDLNLSSWLNEKKAVRVSLDREAHLDEWYIDTVCVHPDFRGSGIGTALLTYAEHTAAEHGDSKLSLNVETKKEAAIRLYERIGFSITEPWTIIGDSFHHMVKHL